GRSTLATPGDLRERSRFRFSEEEMADSAEHDQVSQPERGAAHACVDPERLMSSSTPGTSEWDSLGRQWGYAAASWLRARWFVSCTRCLRWRLFIRRQTGVRGRDLKLVYNLGERLRADEGADSPEPVVAGRCHARERAARYERTDHRHWLQ